MDLRIIINEETGSWKAIFSFDDIKGHQHVVEGPGNDIKDKMARTSRSLGECVMKLFGVRES